MKLVLLGVLLFTLVGTVHTLGHESILWDASVYIGMGKFIFSDVGLWEPARPIMIPLFLGLGDFAGADPIVLIHIMNLALGALSIWLFYQIIRNQKFGDAITLLFALHLLLIYITNRMIVEVPALTLTLGALVVVKKKPVIAGFLLACAVLTKFNWLLVLPAFLFMALTIKMQKAIRLCLGAAVPLLFFATFSYFAYENPFAPFLLANSLINSVAGNATCPSDSTFYLVNLIPPNFLLLCSFVGFLKVSRRQLFYFFAFIIPFIYHSFILNCKDLRYALMFLPFMYFLISSIKDWKISKVLLGIAVITLSVSIVNSWGYTYELSPDQIEFDSEISKVSGDVWTSTPFAAFSDAKISELLYYPTWNSEKIGYLMKKPLPNTIILNSCDIPCLDSDTYCEEMTQKFYERVKRSHTLAFSRSNNCRMEIYER